MVSVQLGLAVVLTILCVFGFGASQDYIDEVRELPVARPFLSLISVDLPCHSSLNRTGLCVTASKCAYTLKGISEGSCAENMQVCCVTVLTCGNSTSSNNTYFINPAFPQHSMEARQCRVQITKSEDVCQMKLEFHSFVLMPPTNGICSQDYFAFWTDQTVGQNSVLCGENSGQHVIVSVENLLGPLFLTMMTSGTAERSWSIRVIQQTCKSPRLAPRNCLQYFETPLGEIRTFGYNIGLSSTSHIIHGLNYAICIRRPTGFCGVTFEADAFDLGPASNTSVINNCNQENFLQLPAGTAIEGGPTPGRICGRVFAPVNGVSDSAPIQIVTTGPLVLYFSSEQRIHHETTSNNYGFQLRYVLNTCRTG